MEITGSIKYSNIEIPEEGLRLSIPGISRISISSDSPEHLPMLSRKNNDWTIKLLDIKTKTITRGLTFLEIRPN